MSTPLIWLLLTLVVFALLAWRGVHYATAILVAVLAATGAWLVWWLVLRLLDYITLD